MAASADPLRNTLDHLALDPAGKEDRKYLVSMLRRLGYSEREIRKAIGHPGGERIIEIEYTGSGRVPRLQQEPEEDAFEVVAEEPADFSFEEQQDFEPVEEWTEEWPEETEEAFDEDAWEIEEDSQDLVDDGEDEEELVEFIPREETAEEPEEDAWEEGDDEWVLEDAGDEAPVEEWAEEPEEEPEEELVGFTVARGRRPGPVAEPDDWQEADDAWEEAEDKDWIPLDEDVPAPDSPPGEVWETQQEQGEVEWEPADAWDEAEDSWDEDPTPQPDYHDAEEAVDAMPEKGYQYEEYSLYTRTVELSSGRKQRIYFFAKGEPKSGEPAPLPDGYVVERNQRTGLPFLRRADAQAPSPQPVVDDETGAEVRCHAVTQGGTQCKNHARENSKYCGTHKGWRGPRVE